MSGTVLGVRNLMMNQTDGVFAFKGLMLSMGEDGHRPQVTKT